MNDFLKSVPSRMSKNTKTIRIFTKQLKRKQRKTTTLTNYLNVLEISKEIWNIMKNIIPRSNINRQIFHTNLRLTKWMFIITLK